MHDHKVLMGLSDSELAKLLDGPQPGSAVHEQIKFEMQRRAMDAQKRAALAAEKYTRLTFWFIVVTAMGSLLNAFISWTK